MIQFFDINSDRFIKKKTLPIGIISALFLNCPILAFSFESLYELTERVTLCMSYSFIFELFPLSCHLAMGDINICIYLTYSRHRFLKIYLFYSFFPSFGNDDVYIAAFIVRKQIDVISSVFQNNMMTLLRIEEFNCWHVYLCVYQCMISVSTFLSLVRAKITKMS